MVGVGAGAVRGDQGNGAVVEEVEEVLGPVALEKIVAPAPLENVVMPGRCWRRLT